MSWLWINVVSRATAAYYGGIHNWCDGHRWSLIVRWNSMNFNWLEAIVSKLTWRRCWLWITLHQPCCQMVWPVPLVVWMCSCCCRLCMMPWHGIRVNRRGHREWLLNWDNLTDLPFVVGINQGVGSSSFWVRKGDDKNVIYLRIVQWQREVLQWPKCVFRQLLLWERWQPMETKPWSLSFFALCETVQRQQVFLCMVRYLYL